MGAHVPDEPFDTGDPTVTCLSGDIRTAVATALETADGKTLEIFGADVAAQSLEHGLVDELLIHLPPVLLGDGVRLFARPGGRRVDLEPIGTTQSGPVTHLRYRVKR